MKLRYDKNQLRKAAAFIYLNNINAQSWPDVQGEPGFLEKKIHDMMVRAAQDPDCQYASTGGWIIFFDRSEDRVFAEIYVDPSVSDRVKLEDEEI